MSKGGLVFDGWGNFSNGRLGNGSTAAIVEDASTVSDINLITSGSDQIAADIVVGAGSTCVVHTNGTVKCFGSARDGQLGNGNTTNTDANHPDDTYAWHDFGSPVVDIAGGSQNHDLHYCALTASGEIYCWGQGNAGGMGYSATASVGDNELMTDMPPVAVWGPAQASPDTVRPYSLIAWYDASDLSTVHENAGCSDTAEDGDTVLCWQDKASGSKHLNTTGLTGPSVDYDAQHGKPALYFDGSENLCIASFGGLSGAQAYTIFIAIEWEESTTKMTTFEYGTSSTGGTQIRLDVDQPANYIRHSQQSSTWNVDYSGWEDYTNEMNILRFSHSGGNNGTGTKRLAFNGYMIPSADSTADGSGAPNLTADVEVCLGSETNENNGVKGKIAEVIIYDTELGIANVDSVDAYLRAKWQKGVDGIATTGLGAHYDAMKAETTTTDACATAATPATDAGLVQCWKDRSANANHVEQTTSGSRPALVESNSDMGGGRSVHFTSDTLDIASGTGLPEGDSPWHLNIAFDRDSALTGTAEFNIAIGPNSGDQEIIIGGPNTKLYLGGASNVHEYTSITSYLNGTGSYIQSHNAPGGAGTARLNMEGVFTPHDSVPNWGAFNIPANPPLSLGGRTDGVGLSADQHISEFLVYSRSLSVAEQAENDRYLMEKWGKFTDHTKAPGGVAHGMVLWLDADDSTTISTAACSATVSAPSDGSTISCFRDKSGMANHLADDTGAPTYQTGEFNGRPVIRFTGSENMSISDLIGMDGGDEPFTVFAVANTSQTGADGKILSFGDNATTAMESWNMGLGGSGAYRSQFENATVKTTTTNIFASTGKTAVITMSYNGDGVRNITNQLIYENGVKKPAAKLEAGSDGDAAIAATPMLHIGSKPDDSQKWQGDIAEVIIYTRVLSDAERQAVEAYLAQKWLDEPYYTDCIHAEDSGETVDGSFTVDTEGYNGPRAPFSVTCDFSPYSNLVGWWRLDEASGTSAADSAGSNTGTLVGGTLVGKSGIHGHGMEFDGTDDRITTSWAGISGSSSRTFTAWFKTSLSARQTILSYGTEAVGEKISIEIDGTSDNLLRLVGGSSAITGTTSITDGEWHHMAVVITDDGDPSIDEVKIYVDGVEETTTGSSSQTIDTGTASTFMIGRDFNDTSKDWNGSLDEIRVYNTDLTAAQILQLYNEGRR